MTDSMTKVSSNWSHIGGCPISQCVQELAADPDIFMKSDIDKLVKEEKSILLSKEQSSDSCELYINKFPSYKIQAISFVCNIAKVEVFQGSIKEYVETVYGIELEKTDDEFKSYRYDIEIQKSGVTHLTLRFLTNCSEVCIFGIVLHTSPNPNGITSLLPFNRCCNTHDTSQLEMKANVDPGNNEPSKHNLFLLEQQAEQKLKVTNEEGGGINEMTNEILDKLKFHIDERLKEIEIRIHKTLAEIEQRQTKKLDKLLYTLENKK